MSSPDSIGLKKKREAYLSFCGDICRNFDKPWDKVGSKLDFAFEFLQHIPAEVWKGLVAEAIRSWDRFPTNWTKAVGELYERVPQVQRKVAYDPVEDLRFPVALMQQAFSILMEHGFNRYWAYCEAVSMPNKDRDRVEYKAQLCRQGEDPAAKAGGLYVGDGL